MNRTEEKRAARPRLVRKALRLLFTVLLAAGLLILCRTLVNKLFLVNYGRENYAEYPEKLLSPMVFGDNYVVPYNLGNAAYQRQDLELAERYFRSALEARPPEEEKECAVRVNLALAMLHRFSFDTLDLQDEEETAAALEVLYAARAVLTETGCACESADAWNGHSPEAESLKHDIDDMIRKLTAPPPSGGGGGGQDSGNDESGGGGDSSEDPQSGDPQPQDGGENRQPGQTQESLQQSLENDLKEQKQNLESGNYSNSDVSLTYIDAGDMVGYGEGMSW